MTGPVIFFEAPREHFFRPLTWQDREACAAVLRRLHDRVHGPEADYAEVLTRELVLEITLAVVAQPAYRQGALGGGDAVDAEAERSYALGFPGCQAWQPGYEPLLQHLQAGQGHHPDEADKGAQSDPGTTGCAYADEVLLPALREHGRFVDQELWPGSQSLCVG